MKKRQKQKLLLFLSVAMLVTVFYFFGKSVAEKIDSDDGRIGQSYIGKFAAGYYNTVDTCADSICRFSKDTADAIRNKMADFREKSAERKRLKEETKLAKESKCDGSLEALTLNKVDAQIIASDEVAQILLPEVMLNPQVTGIYSIPDGSRYVAYLKGKDSQGNPETVFYFIPHVVGNKEFRETNDVVFTRSEVTLFGGPDYLQSAMTVPIQTKLLRAGISPDGCYQLITDDGKILYADGASFGRFPEPTDFTENISNVGDSAGIDVKYLSQLPSLPTGCEVTCLATVLNYWGFDVTKETLADDFLPKKAVGAANFYQEFVGNPRNSSSYGCYAPVIVNTANAYLDSVGSNMRAYDLTGNSMKELLDYIRSGYPILIWTNQQVGEDATFTTRWLVDGEYLQWKANLHCVVLIGYDLNAQTVTVSNPYTGIVSYALDDFIYSFKQFYSQAVLVK